MAGQGAELGQRGHERGGQHGADAGGTPQQSSFSRHRGLARRSSRRSSSNWAICRCSQLDVSLELRPNAPRRQGEAILLGREHVDQLAPALQQALSS